MLMRLVSTKRPVSREYSGFRISGQILRSGGRETKIILSDYTVLGGILPDLDRDLSH